eukprot:364398-Chlamydomonas_euryale.AAC.16
MGQPSTSGARVSTCPPVRPPRAGLCSAAAHTRQLHTQLRHATGHPTCPARLGPSLSTSAVRRARQSQRRGDAPRCRRN